MAEQKSTLSIALTQEELFVLMTYLELPEISGFEPVVFNELMKDQMTVALSVAERGLIARNLLVQQGTELVPTDVIKAVLGTCAGPETSLVIINDIPKQVGANFLFHTARKMVVYHSVPILGIHQFIALQNLAAMQKAAFSLLQLPAEDRPALPVPPGFIPESLLHEADNASEQGGKDAALAVLSKSSLSPETSALLAESLTNPTVTSTLMYATGQQTGTAHYAGFTLVQSEGVMWLLHPVDDGSQPEGTVHLKTTCLEEITRTFQSLFTTA